MEAAVRLNAAQADLGRSPARQHDTAAAIASTASGSPAPQQWTRSRRSPGSPSPAGVCGSGRAEFEELAVSLDRHAAKARALAEELACRTATDDWRPLLGPLVTFQSSLLDMHHLVLDAIGELASRSVGTRGSPSRPTPLRATDASASMSPSPSRHPLQLSMAASSHKASSSTAVAISSDDPKEASAAPELFVPDTSDVAGRSEVLRFVKQMLCRKRDAMVSGEAVRDARKLQEVEEDIARVELELSMLASVEQHEQLSPQRAMRDVRTPHKANLFEDSPTPSQGSTATPHSIALPLPTPQTCAQLVTPMSLERVSEPELSTVVGACSQQLRPDDAVSSGNSPRTREHLSPARSSPAVQLFSPLSTTSQGRPNPSPSEREASRTEDPAAGECFEAQRLQQQEMPGSCATLVPAAPSPLQRQELLARLGDTSDSVEIGSARQAKASQARAVQHGDSETSSLPITEPQSCAEPGLQSRRSQAERPAWCWGGSSSSSHAAAANASEADQVCVQSSSSDSPKSPLLPTTSEALYEIPAPVSSHDPIADENEPTAIGVATSALPPTESPGRPPLSSLPPPWAFQGQMSSVPSTNTTAEEQRPPIAKPVAARGKENVCPVPLIAGPVAISKAHSAPATPAAPPPQRAIAKAPAAKEEESLAVSSTGASSSGAVCRAASTPIRRGPAGSSGAAAGLYRNTPSPRAGKAQKAASPLAQLMPRSLHFTSPSPHRYSTASDQDVFEWASPIKPCEDPSSTTAAAAEDNEEGDDAECPPSPLLITNLPPPLPTGGPDGDWRPPSGSPVKIAASRASPAKNSQAVLASGSPAKRLAPSNSPARSVGSPARLGMGNSPARSITPARHFLKSPSASVLVSPARSSGMNERSASHSSGDTPRNLTDWRKSLQMARRQDDSCTKPTPWR